jgi:hypothetical protein
MPIHDWSRVQAGIFHHFHHSWIEEIKRALNRELLPSDNYALVEQLGSGLGLDVLTLQGPTRNTPEGSVGAGCVALADSPPKVRFRQRKEVDQYADKAKVVAVRHASDHRVVAMVEVVSPGNKSTRAAVRRFVEKADEMLKRGVHLLILDLFQSGPRDPQGLHKLIWDEVSENDFALPPQTPLTLAAYIGYPCPEAFVEPVSVGAALPNMPLFLTPDLYVPLPLETTYQAAWQAVPAFWRDVVEGGGSSG